jgi:hypothetical protein
VREITASGLILSGWGPGGRRSKSCLPDSRKALVTRGFCRFWHWRLEPDGAHTSPDGRHHNRRIGKVRARGESDGLTRREAEREARRIIDTEIDPPSAEPAEPPPTVDEVVDQLRDGIAIEGARLS